MSARWWFAALLAIWASAAQAHSCTVSATPLAFGTYVSPQGPRVDSSATVQVRCTPTYLLLACRVSYTLSLSAGQSPSGGLRQLSAGTGLLRWPLLAVMGVLGALSVALAWRRLRGRSGPGTSPGGEAP